MKSTQSNLQRAFTLLETVIAIGVLAVLLTGFMIVFAPAAAGIRKSISVQEADRLVSALELELVTLRSGQESAVIRTGFDKGFFLISNSTGVINGSNDSGNPSEALFVYQYRGSLANVRSDGTLKELSDVTKKIPGKDYVVQSMMRKSSDPFFRDDLKALEGPVYLVKCVQLIFGANGLEPVSDSNRGKIVNPKPKVEGDTNYKAGPFTDPIEYPEAVIAFTADFYLLPSRSESYIKGAAFNKAYSTMKNPVFSRNLAIRR